VHAHAVQQLHEEFPDLVVNRTGAQLHHHLPQDIQLMGAEQLEALGPIELVVVGWPCQGSSAAGKGRGLDDDRSGLFTELVRVIGIRQALYRQWGRPLGYVIEHVAAGFDRQPKVRKHYAAARGLLGPEVVFDEAQVRSPCAPPQSLVDQPGGDGTAASCNESTKATCRAVCSPRVGVRQASKTAPDNGNSPMGLCGQTMPASVCSKHIFQLRGIVCVLARGGWGLEVHQSSRANDMEETDCRRT
jgi:hypothetical protein